MTGKTSVKYTCLILTAALTLTSCGGKSTETEPETEPVSIIEIGTEAEETVNTDILQMGLDASVLPTFGNVTTAADNAVLAPAYLQVGDQSPVVARIQEQLMYFGYMDNDEPTTYFGAATAEAVKKFQRQKGFPQDGIVGKQTWDALFSSDTPYYKVKNGDDGDDISQIQLRLYQLGYLTENALTGYFGDTTEAAVKKMQERNGISIDGAVGKESINLLYSDEIKANLIGIGDSSDIVLKYQRRLIDLGYLRDKADGTFGSGTQKAVMEFQSRNDQIVDGYLGPDTRIALDSPDAKPFGLRLGDRSDSVTLAQKRLAHYDYLPSQYVTGYYGDLTRNAVIKFQECNGLTADGTVGRATMTKLESDNAVKKPANVVVASSGTPATTAAQTQAQTQAAGGSNNTGSSNTGAASAPATSQVASYDTSGPAGNLISIAASKLGCSYVWGSKGPNSFDCSGFVYWCLNQAGVSQSYLTSSGWRNPGRYEMVSSFDNIRAGDIVVVSGHVGIASGNGTVIDASSSNGRVVHRSLSSWWRNNFIVAWRIFG
ncbi:MAG: peptidoglycan-binding protein [Lachnospiraceae bacterium]|nr:peptidoglycan-binding protein [Lachnospiraceae bacterium]